MGTEIGEVKGELETLAAGVNAEVAKTVHEDMEPIPLV